MTRTTPILCMLLALAASGAARAQEPPFLIAFHGEFCPPCKEMAPVLKSIEADGIHVQQVDVGANQQMVQIYKVQVVPTVVCVGKGGKEQGRLTGLQSKKSIMRLLGNASPWESASQTTNSIDQPTWRTYSPPGAIDNGNLMQQVLSRLEPAERQRMESKYANDPATKIHEATHLLDNRIANSMGAGYCAFFVGSGVGNCVVLREPNVSTSTVAQYISPQYRDGLYFKTYIVDLPRQPGYPTSQILDEWNASCNGWQGSRELGASDTGDSMMARHFCNFADALLVAIQRHDPSYPDLDELTKFVNWQKNEVGKMAGNVQVDAIAGSHGGNGGYYSETIRRPSQPVGPQPQQPQEPASWEDPKWVKWRADIEARFVACKGQDGRDGIDGKDGEPGTAEIDYDQLAAKIDVQQVINNLDVTAIAAAIAQTLPKPPPAYVPPTDEQLAAAVEPHLSPISIRQNEHSAPIVIPLGGEGRLSPFWIRARSSEEFKETNLGDEIDLNLQRESGSSL